MVPMELLPLEDDVGYDAEDDKRDDFLYDLQLHQGEGSAVVDEANAVGGHHETVFDQRDAPAEKNDQRQRQLAEPRNALQLQMAVPRKRHEHVRTNQ